MTPVTDPYEIDRLTRLAQAALDRRQPTTYRIEVVPQAVLQEDEWYQVIVQSDNDVRAYEFYDVLAQAEAELQDEQDLHVLLVPASGT